MKPLRELQGKWDRASRWYDLATVPLELLLFWPLRSKLLRSVSGRVLEVAVGTGLNYSRFPAGVDIIAVDLSLGMLSHARQRGVAKTALVDAERLAFANDTFDTVVSTLGMCTFPNPVQALREMRRVCRPEGRILLMEHGRSNWPAIANWQDRRAPKHAAFLGCWWNREPLENIRKAGLEPVVAKRGFFGMVHVIEAVA